jgi:2-oxoglutarate ferredoxin oxidoreductase subunit delta
LPASRIKVTADLLSPGIINTIYIGFVNLPAFPQQTIGRRWRSYRWQLLKDPLTYRWSSARDAGCAFIFVLKKVIVQSVRLNAAGYQPAAFKDNGDCTGCAICAVVCPEVAIEVYRA